MTHILNEHTTCVARGRKNKTKQKYDKIHKVKILIDGQTIPEAILKFLPSVQKRNKLCLPLNRSDLKNLRRIVRASGQL